MTEPVATGPMDAEPVATEPIPPGATASARGARWPVALLVAVLALGGLAAGIAVLSGRPIPEARRWVPSSAALVIELRPDLPGDQRDGLGALLAHFPGFRDRTLLDRKLDETAERLVGQVSGGAVSYLRDVKPWLAGPMLIALIPAAAGEPPDWLIVATTDGTVGASDLPAHDEALESVTVTMAERLALIGTEGAVGLARTAHDARAAIDTDPAYAAALAALGGDRLISVVARPDQASGALETLGMAHALPSWIAAGIRAEPNALVADVVAAPIDLAAMGIPGGRALNSGPIRFAAHVPAGSLAFLELHPMWTPDTGPIVGGAPPLGPLPSALAVLTGPDGPLGWVEHAAFVVGAIDGPEGPAGALLLGATDAAAAEAGAASLRNVLALAATAAGGEVDVSVHDGTEIAAADVGPALAGLLDGQMPDGAGEELDELRVAVALDGDTVLVGLGEASVIALLDVDPGASLATSTAFRSAVEAAGGSGGAIGYLDLAGLVDLLVAELPDTEAERWATDLAPFAAPLRALAFTLTADPEAPGFRIVLTVE